MARTRSYNYSRYHGHNRHGLTDGQFYALREASIAPDGTVTLGSTRYGAQTHAALAKRDLLFSTEADRVLSRLRLTPKGMDIANSIERQSGGPEIEVPAEVFRAALLAARAEAERIEQLVAGFRERVSASANTNTAVEA